MSSWGNVLLQLLVQEPLCTARTLETLHRRACATMSSTKVPSKLGRCLVAGVSGIMGFWHGRRENIVLLKRAGTSTVHRHTVARTHAHRWRNEYVQTVVRSAGHVQEVGGWLGGNLQRLQTRGEGLPSAPDARDLDVTSVSPDPQNECLFLVLPQANVDIRWTTWDDDIVDLRTYLLCCWPCSQTNRGDEAFAFATDWQHFLQPLASSENSQFSPRALGCSLLQKHYLGEM